MPWPFLEWILDQKTSCKGLQEVTWGKFWKSTSGLSSRRVKSLKSSGGLVVLLGACSWSQEWSILEPVFSPKWFSKNRYIKRSNRKKYKCSEDGMRYSLFPTIRLAGRLLLPEWPGCGQRVWNGRLSGEQAGEGGLGGGQCLSFKTLQKSNPSTQSHFFLTFDVVFSKGILQQWGSEAIWEEKYRIFDKVTSLF